MPNMISVFKLWIHLETEIVFIKKELRETFILLLVSSFAELHNRECISSIPPARDEFIVKRR